MNFLHQTKLTKEEWCKMEQPIENNKEQNILKMINNGYNDINISYVPYLCLHQFLNISSLYDEIIFEKILKEKLIKYNKKNVLQLNDNDFLYKKIKVKKLSKTDLFKVNNSINLFEENKYDDKIIEFVLLSEIKNLSKILQKNDQNNKKCVLSIYNIYYLSSCYENKLNICFKNILTQLKNNFLKHIECKHILSNISKIIEHNSIFKYQNYTLHQHQKDIFTLFKKYNTIPKCVFYCAPTSSGKTLSPLALCNDYKVIFVCASKHIGLSLAKSGYYLKKRIGFAFGCNDSSNIRLNYNAINSYIEDKYKRKKPDHSDGKNVDLMICDLISFEYAMLYMKAFHSIENMILFWDEPTIGLDINEHILHEKIKYIWDINVIPNLVFSCATLPKEDKLNHVIKSFQQKFNNAHVEYIESYDQTTNLMIYDEYGNIIMPHMYFENYDKMIEFLNYQGKKYYKFYNCNECCKFILYYDKYINHDFIDKTFHSLDNVTMDIIKDSYVECLKSIESKEWINIRNQYFKLYPLSTILNDEIGCNLTTNHAYSLTNGPTLYISDQVQNICKYLLFIAKLKQEILNEINKKIKYNSEISNTLIKKRKDYEDKLEKYKDNEKIMENMRLPQDVIELQRQIETLENRIYSLHLDNKYKPNTRDHFQVWNSARSYDNEDVYTSHIEDYDIKKVMELYTIDSLYKILLLMGIGIFSNEIMSCSSNHNIDIKEENNKYVEIMKGLAEQKALYLIIANSDYIYGTNYQFSHCYLGKDMKNMSQEKVIQCIGRIGRQEKNKHFSFRFRCKEQIQLLYNIPNISIEAENMNKLFN